MKKLLAIMLLSFFVSALGGPTLSALCSANGQGQETAHTQCKDMAKQDGDRMQKSSKPTCCCPALAADVSRPVVYIMAQQTGGIIFSSDAERESNIPESPYKPPNFI